MSLLDKFSNFFKYNDNKILYKKLIINYIFFILIFVIILLFVRKSGDGIKIISNSPIFKKNSVKKLTPPLKVNLQIPKKISPPIFKMSSFLDSFDHS